MATRSAPEDIDWRLSIPEARRRRLRQWFWSIAAATFLVLVVGGVTRLTRSGLSIVDWDPILGIVPPMTEAGWEEAFARYRQFPEYQQLRHGMTLQEFKWIYFWEYLHRLLARAIGLVFALPFVAFWMAGWLNRPVALRALGLFTLGALQGVLGWIMVASGLIDRPSVSHFRLAAHLSLAFIIFGASVWLARDLTVPARDAVTPRTRTIMMRGLVVIGILFAAQVVWGAFVAGLDAGLIFNTFPLMGGRLVPPDVLTLAASPRDFLQSLVTVQWTHRMLGTILLFAGLVFFVRVRRVGIDRASRRYNAMLALLLCAQYAIGVLTLLWAVPVPLGVLHQATAMVIAGVWIAWLHHVRSLPADVLHTTRS